MSGSVESDAESVNSADDVEWSQKSVKSYAEAKSLVVSRDPSGSEDDSYSSSDGNDVRKSTARQGKT